MPSRLPSVPLFVPEPGLLAASLVQASTMQGIMSQSELRDVTIGRYSGLTHFGVVKRQTFNLGFEL